MSDIVEQSWTPITAKSAKEVVIYLACSANIFFLSFFAFQWQSPRTASRPPPSSRPTSHTILPFSFFFSAFEFRDVTMRRWRTSVTWSWTSVFVAVSLYVLISTSGSRRPNQASRSHSGLLIIIDISKSKMQTAIIRNHHKQRNEEHEGTGTMTNFAYVLMLMLVTVWD